MGFFYNYEKPGPGVDANAPKKKGFFLYLEILLRKFSEFLRTNFLYFISSLPIFIIMLVFISPHISNLIIGGEIDDHSELFILMVDLFFTGVVFNFYGSGPVSAAYAFIIKCFVHSKPVWIVSDGFDKLKENFKQSIILMIIDILYLFITFNAMQYYMTETNTISTIALVIILMTFMLYTLAHIFIYQIMITYKCRLRDIIKNSFVFAISKLPMCILLLIITGVLSMLIFGVLGIVSVIVYATIGMCLTKFPLEFYAVRVIDENIKKTQGE